MTRTRVAARRWPSNNFNNRRVAAAKEITNVGERRRNHERRFKIKFLLPQGKNDEVKQRDNVVRGTRIHRKAIFSASVRERRYPRN